MKNLLLLALLFYAFTVQGQNKIESALFEYYDGFSWLVSGGYNYQYDSNNNLTSMSYYSFDQDVWTPLYKSDYTYNANNRMLTETVFNADDNNQFEITSKSTNTYNASNQLISTLSQDWNGTIWINTYKTDITYNGNLFVNAVSKTWDGSQFVDDFKSTPTYTGTNATQWLSEYWNGTQWIIDYRTLLTYNANNKITNYKTEIWDGSIWEEEENYAYLLATNGNWLTETGSFYGDLAYNRNYNYDTNALMSNFGNPFKDKTGTDYVFGDFPYVNKILGDVYSDYDESNFTYTPVSRITYNYLNSLPLAREDFQLNKVNLYPNPTHSIVNIKTDKTIEEVAIIDLSGRTTNVKLSENNTIDVNTLSSGIYFIVIKTTEGFFREKFIKN